MNNIFVFLLAVVSALSKRGLTKEAVKKTVRVFLSTLRADRPAIEERAIEARAIYSSDARVHVCACFEGQEIPTFWSPVYPRGLIEQLAVYTKSRLSSCETTPQAFSITERGFEISILEQGQKDDQVLVLNGLLELTPIYHRGLRLVDLLDRIAFRHNVLLSLQEKGNQDKSLDDALAVSQEAVYKTIPKCNVCSSFSMKW